MMRLQPQPFGKTRPRACRLALILALLAAQRGSAAEPADLILRGGKIVTMDERRPQAEALAVRGDRIVAECYFYDKPVKWHLNYRDVVAHQAEVGARRLILTHMSREMLAHAEHVPEECAHDGLVVTV